MAIDRGGALIALEICDAFGVRPTPSVVRAAFHELTRATSLMRQRAARTGAALEETVGDGTHLVFIADLLIRNLDLCLPQEQAIMAPHLETTRTWLSRQGFDV